MEQTQNEESKLPQSALQLILKSGTFGINGAKRLFSIGLCFGLVNLLLLAYGLYRYFGQASSNSNGLFILAIILLGILFTAYAIYKAYQYLFVEIAGFVYKQSHELFRNISSIIVENTDTLVKRSKGSLIQAIDYTTFIKQKFENRPKFVVKSITYLLSKIPVIRMLKHIKNERSSMDKTKASELLYSEIDTYVTQKIVNTNNTKWVFWLLPLNIVVMLTIIILKL